MKTKNSYFSLKISFPYFFLKFTDLPFWKKVYSKIMQKMLILQKHSIKYINKN